MEIGISLRFIRAAVLKKIPMAIVGRVRLRLARFVSAWWAVDRAPSSVRCTASPRGLTTFELVAGALAPIRPAPGRRRRGRHRADARTEISRDGASGRRDPIDRCGLDRHAELAHYRRLRPFSKAAFT